MIVELQPVSPLRPSQIAVPCGGCNGDRFETTIVGSGQPTETPGEIRITETHTITEGTGRFAGAQGRFTVERVASAITFATSGSFEGTITSPRAAD